MLSIGAMSGGQGGYYGGLAREDYYTKGGEPLGEWQGRGAQDRGLSGQINRAEFLEVFSGFQDGRKLVQSAGKETHRPGWDLTFSAPKSVSTLWSQADQAMGLEIRAAHLSAVQKGIEYLEENALWTRRGQGGRELERCGAVFATFEHGTSRAQDPQIHTHALLLNIGMREDGTTGTLESKAVFAHKMAAGAIYRTELAHQLERRLGLEFEREKSWFEVKGVSTELTHVFSKRRQAIEEALTKEGRSGAVASAVAALQTRDKKAHIPREKLFEEWRAVGKEMGWSTEQAKRLDRGRQPERDKGKELHLASEQAVEKMMEQNAFFSKVQLTRHLAEQAQTLGVGADAVLQQVKETLKGPDIRALGVRFHVPVYSTTEMLKLEESLLKKVEEANGTRWFSVWDQHLKPILDKYGSLNPEQRQALKTVTQGETSIAAVVGMAGTGKTTLLKAAREAWESAGYSVLGAALSGKAARGLEEGAGIKSTSIAKTLYDLEAPRLALTGKERPFWKAPDWSPASKVKLPVIRPHLRDDLIRFTDKTVLVVDEAGMVGTRQMDTLMSHAKAAGAKIVLVGDPGQLQAIEAGGPFKAIAERVKETATLTTIVRQREEWQRQAVKDFATGNAGVALREFASRGLLHVSPDSKSARQAVIGAWKSKGLHKPKDNLIVAAMNADVKALNREAQALRLFNRFSHGKAVEVEGEKIYSGDRIVFTKRSKALGVENGTFGNVKEIGFRGNIRIELENGEQKVFSSKQFNSFTLGYAVTTHRAQGATAENAYVLTAEQMQDLHISYVQASRARGETRIFTTKAECGEELSDLAKRMEQSHQKVLALDATRTDSRNFYASPQPNEGKEVRPDDAQKLDSDLFGIQQQYAQRKQLQQQRQEQDHTMIHEIER